VSIASLKKSKTLGDKVLSSSLESIEHLTKHELYSLLKIPHEVSSTLGLSAAVQGMGFRQRQLMVKMEGLQNDGRGLFHIVGIDDFLARTELEPGYTKISYFLLTQMITQSRMINDRETKWIVMPYYHGKEYLLTCLCRDGRILWHQELFYQSKNVATTISALSSHLNTARMVCDEYGLDYWASFHFIDEHFIDVDPFLVDWIDIDYPVPLLAILLAEGNENFARYKVTTGVTKRKVLRWL